MIGMTPPPRSKEGTHPGRVSHVRNTETPTESGPLSRLGRPIVRAAEFSGGNRMLKKRMPVGESRQDTATNVAAPPAAVAGQLAGYRADSVRAPKGALTWAGEP